MIFARLTLLAALAASAAADFTISSPSANVWWVAKSINTLTWNCKDPVALSHPAFTVLVANKDPKVQTAPIAIIGIQNNFDCYKTITQDQISAAPGTGYTVLFANTLNQTEIWATSEEFEIKPLGAAYPTSTPGFTSAGSPSATSGSGAANSSSTAAPGKGNGAVATGAQVGGVLAVVGAVMGMVL
ncbi:hypothetical protein DXG01_015144 [Tephrocybe rancida]|nr:hypothetical protein DXG01_015144 [Tephrocybe rancida]